MHLITRLAALAPPRLTTRALTYGAGLMWLWVTTIMPADLNLWLAIAWVAAPALVALAASRAMRKKWWRVPVIWFLFLNSYGATAPLILGLGYAWAISQAWILAHPVETSHDETAAQDEDAERPAAQHTRRLARSGNPAKAAKAAESNR